VVTSKADMLVVREWWQGTYKNLQNLAGTFK